MSIRTTLTAALAAATLAGAGGYVLGTGGTLPSQATAVAAPVASAPQTAPQAPAVAPTATVPTAAPVVPQGAPQGPAAAPTATAPTAAPVVPSAPQGAPQGPAATTGGTLVNLNTATRDELIAVSGIGAKTADRLIAARPLASVEAACDVPHVTCASWRGAVTV